MSFSLNLSVIVTNSGVQSMQNFKGCVPSNLCTSSIGSYSLQLGNLSTVSSFECCSTDNCNSGTLAGTDKQLISVQKIQNIRKKSIILQQTSLNHVVFVFPATNTTNGLECFSCATPQCNTPIQCIGVQDRCIQLDGELNFLKYEPEQKQ